MLHPDSQQNQGENNLPGRHVILKKAVERRKRKKWEVKLKTGIMPSMGINPMVSGSNNITQNRIPVCNLNKSSPKIPLKICNGAATVCCIIAVTKFILACSYNDNIVFNLTN